MIDANGTHTLEEFRDNAEEHLRRIKETGRPEVLTIDGEPSLVVQDIESYHRLLDALDEAQTIVGVGRGLRDVEAGRTLPAAEAFDEIRRRHDIPRDA
jgi:PHD/YefM family antitoxin component YafN of YafNO toxin-antitoxin module